MNLNWNLEKLYPSFESDEFKNDLVKLDSKIEEIKKYADSLSESNLETIKSLEEYIKLYSELDTIESKLFAYTNLILSVNTKDKLGLKYSDILEDKVTNVVESNTKIERYISSIKDIDSVINKSEILKEHEFILKEIIENSKYLLSDKEENIIATMRNTGSSAWLKLKDNLISNLKVDINIDGEDKKLPLTVVLNMAYDENKDVRKKAYEAEIASYKSVEEGVCAALNAIKGEVINVCKFRGYESPLQESILKSRLDEETLNAMLEAMKESFPSFRKYLRRKSEMLGYKNGLPFYELYAPVSKANMKFTYDEAAKFVVKNFKSFSDNLSNFAKNAIDNSWIDVMPKEGKVGGGFCANLHCIGESRILLNFGGSFSDVVTLGHELGHGFHGDCLKGEKVLNSEYPMPIAETASTFSETIIKRSALKDASKEEALAILEAEISDCTQVIVDIYSRFLFEKSFFEARKEGNVSVEETKELMLKAQLESYGDGLDPEYLHPYMWTWKPHYYDAEYSFYNFPYAFGLLFARGLYAEYMKQGEKFSKEYEKLLSVTGKNNLKDVAKIIGIDIQNKDFWKASLKTVEEDINKFIELSKEM